MIKESNTIIENIKFLIEMYKREAEKEQDIETKMIYENYIMELELVIKLNEREEL
jgi:hypothetical protein